MADRGQELDKLKKAATELVSELHARKLAIPAGVILVMIVAAMVVLPKKSTPPPPVAAVPISNANQNNTPQLATVANLTLVGATPLDNGHNYGQQNPFAVKGSGTKSCKLVSGSDPMVYHCVIGDLPLTFHCLGLPDDTGICAKKAGSTGATGSAGTGTGTGTGATNSTGAGTGTGTTTPTSGGTKKKTTSTYYTADVTYDGKAIKNLVAGKAIPDDTTTIALYAGTDSSNKSGMFVAGDNIAVTGVTADPDLGSFKLAVGKSATLTETNGTAHTLKLTKLTKVTKSS